MNKLQEAIAKLDERDREIIVQRFGLFGVKEQTQKEVADRLGDLNKRGVAVRDGQTLLDLYKERVPLYEKYADYIVSEDHISIEETIEKILEIL